MVAEKGMVLRGICVRTTPVITGRGRDELREGKILKTELASLHEAQNDINRRRAVRDFGLWPGVDQPSYD